MANDTSTSVDNDDSTQIDPQYEVRGALPHGAWDGVAFAAEAMLRAAGQKRNSASVNAASEAIAKKNNLHLFHNELRIVIDKTKPVLDKDTGVQLVDEHGNPVFYGTETITSVDRVTGKAIKPIVKTVENSKDTFCQYDEYRHENGKSLQPNVDKLLPADGYKGFAQPLKQVETDCETCKVRPPEMQTLTFDTPTPENKPVTLTEPRLRVKAPVYETNNTLADGRTAGVYNLENAAYQTGFVPDQPDPAARGIAHHGTGIQTIFGTSGEVGAYSAAALANVPVAPGVGVNLGAGYITGMPNSQDQVADARQGSNAPGGTRYNEMENGGRTMYLDGLPVNLGAVFGNVSAATRRAGTKLPLVGITYDPKTGETLDNPNTKTHNNYYYSEVGGGDMAPDTTQSKVEMESGGKRKNGWIQGEPSGPIKSSLNNYQAADLFNQVSIEPQIEKLSDDFYAKPSIEAGQKLVELLNYQSTLVGISNSARIQSKDPQTGNVTYDYSTVSTVLPSQAEFNKLSPWEQVMYQRQMVVKVAADNGIPLNAEQLPEQSPVKGISKEEAIEKWVGYYDELARNHKGAFSALYKDEMGEDAHYGKHDEKTRLPVVRKFVENLPAIQNWPSDQSLDYLDHFISTRSQTDRTNLHANNFNPAENFEMAPEAPVTDRDAASKAIALIASRPDLTSILMQAGGRNRQIADVFFKRDDLSKAVPDDLLDGGRGGSLDALTARGYPPELVNKTSKGKPGEQFSREESQGKEHGDPAVVQQVLADSASNPDIVALRQKDLQGMIDTKNTYYRASDGEVNAMTYGLFTEPGNTGWKQMEDALRASESPEDAARDIKILKDGIEDGKEKVTRLHFGGRSLNDVATAAYAQTHTTNVPATAPAPTTTYTTEVVASNVQKVFGAIAGHPAAAQAFVQAVSANASPEQRRAALSTADGLTQDEQLLLAKTIIGKDPASFQLLVDQSNGSDAIKGTLKGYIANPTPENAKTILAVAASIDKEFPLALNNLAQDPKASALLVKALAAPANAQLASDLAGTVPAEQQAKIGKLAAIKNSDEAWQNVAPLKKAVITTTTVVAAATPDTIDVSRFKAAADIAEPRTRDIARTRAYFETDATSLPALQSLQKNDPQFMKVATINALSASDPKLQEAVLANLRTSGDKNGLITFVTNNFNAQHQLAGILGNLLDAQRSGDTDDIQEYTKELNSFLNPSNPKTAAAHQAALADLETAMMNTQTKGGLSGRQALVTTLGTVFDKISANDLNPLPGVDFDKKVDSHGAPLVDTRSPADQTLATLYHATNAIDVGNTEVGENAVLFVWRSSPTYSSRNLVPVVPYFYDVKKTDVTVDNGNLGGCGTIDRPCPPVPPPPPTPPVVNPNNPPVRQ